MIKIVLLILALPLLSGCATIAAGAVGGAIGVGLANYNTERRRAIEEDAIERYRDQQRAAPSVVYQQPAVIVTHPRWHRHRGWRNW